MQDAVLRLNAALFGRYEIERELGQGGMATVYLASDLKHQRRVALKVLKPELAAVVGAERFLAEIKTTANLQHPHILPLFDSGQVDGFLFYVMPYVEGESLRERLDREHQLPVAEAVRVATAVAHALDYAHRHGVIHRDIKPANVLLHDGQPVIADFGIALAMSHAGGGRLTETGLSLGTPHYMSPEQATGDASLSPATDIYALGCVLYEMLVGEPPYTGSTPQAVLGKIITAEPPSARGARKAVPPNVESAIQRALEKVPADRFSSAEGFVRGLADPTFRYGERTPATNLRDGRLVRRAAVAGWVAAGLFAVGFAWALLRPASEGSRAPLVRFAVSVGEGADVYLGGTRDAVWGRPSRTSLALSPTGELLVYSAWERSGGGIQSRLYARPLGQQRADPIRGTEGGSSPFFSPDGIWIGFFAGTELKRIPVVGGEPETLLTDPRLLERDGPLGASWGDDGTIALALHDGLYRVAGSGGTPTLLVESTQAALGFPRHAQPFWLPGGRALLWHVMPSPDAEGSEIRVLDLETGDQKAVLMDALDPRYARTGHLLFVRRGTLMAVRFDAERLEVVGEPVTVFGDVMHALGAYNPGHTTGAAQVAMSDAGHLVYASGGVFPEDTTRAVRIWSSGEVEELDIDPRRFGRFRVSPQGDRVAFSAGVAGAAAIFVHDIESGVTSLIDTGGSFSDKQEWSGDGLSLVFSSDRDTPARNLYRLVLDGGGGPERLSPSDEEQQMQSWAPTGAIAFVRNSDIWVLRPGETEEPFFASTVAREDDAMFSPDGRWLMYVSDVSGRREVYVRPSPGPGPPVQISSDGGENPVWSRDGTRIFYLERRPGRLVMMAAPVSLSETGRAGRPSPLIDPWPAGTWGNNRGYDVFTDGSFVVAIPIPDAASGATSTRDRLRVSQLHVVLNFFEELRARVSN